MFWVNANDCACVIVYQSDNVVLTWLLHMRISVIFKLYVTSVNNKSKQHTFSLMDPALRYQIAWHQETRYGKPYSHNPI